jgi:hypothetical protein
MVTAFNQRRGNLPLHDARLLVENSAISPFVSETGRQGVFTCIIRYIRNGKVKKDIFLSTTCPQ